jgi:hypothetical protein
MTSSWTIELVEKPNMIFDEVCINSHYYQRHLLTIELSPHLSFSTYYLLAQIMVQIEIEL